MKAALVPPYGATLSTDGSDEASSISKSSLVALDRNAARHAIWPLRLMLTVVIPYFFARSIAKSMATAVNQTPDILFPSQTMTGPRSETTVGCPLPNICPFWSPLRYAGT